MWNIFLRLFERVILVAIKEYLFTFKQQHRWKTQSSLVMEHWYKKDTADFNEASCICMLKQRWSLLKAFSSSHRAGGLTCEI